MLKQVNLSWQVNRSHQEHSVVHSGEYRGLDPRRGRSPVGRMLPRTDQRGRPVLLANQTNDAFFCHGKIYFDHLIKFFYSPFFKLIIFMVVHGAILRLR